MVEGVTALKLDFWKLGTETFLEGQAQRVT